MILQPPAIDATHRRIHHLKGTAREIGLALGRALGARLARNIDAYIRTGPARHGVIDTQALQHGALPWLRRLPQRFQDEFEGLAEGAGLPLQRLAEWCYVEQCLQEGCSALLCRFDGHVWVARNNDFWAPELWGYVTIREVQGRVPTLVFGLEGELFTGTGVNRERLWLHYNWLPAEDAPAPGKPWLPPFVWLTEALETCHDLYEVETLLRDVDRDGGMMLFAVDGRCDVGAVFECTCADHIRREFTGPWIAGTNHPVTQRTTDVPNAPHPPSPSQRRLARLETLAQGLFARDDALTMPWDLIQILADDGVEKRDKDYGTVYANVACPNQRWLWYTLGGYPAASAGAWRALAWPWKTR